MKQNEMSTYLEQKAITLGDKLVPATEAQPPRTTRQKTAAPSAKAKPVSGLARWVLNALRAALQLCLLVGTVFLPMWWYIAQPDLDGRAIMAVSIGLFALWIYNDQSKNQRERRTSAPRKSRKSLRKQQAARPKKLHPLLAGDKGGFMRDLHLDAKTALIDGSNLYHFGHDNELDAQVLGMVVEQLRHEGFRIVCFFDANIFYTLQDHGAFPKEQSHTNALLTEIFGVEFNEIYVVPSGKQADQYIMSSLKNLPISFAVSNDKFRDYAKKYPDVMKGDQWRKGVRISKNEIKMEKHRFETPVLLS